MWPADPVSGVRVCQGNKDYKQPAGSRQEVTRFFGKSVGVGFRNPETQDPGQEVIISGARKVFGGTPMPAPRPIP